MFSKQKEENIQNEKKLKEVKNLLNKQMQEQNKILIKNLDKQCTTVTNSVSTMDTRLKKAMMEQ